MTRFTPRKVRLWSWMQHSLILFLLWSHLPQTVAASQEITVTGVVTDASGQPLSGVSVTVKAGLMSTATSDQGAFSIRVPNNAAILVFSYLGYRTQEITVNERRIINVQMDAGTEMLDDVIVVGYGTQSRASVTGAVSSIKSAELVRTPSVAATSALVGKLAGVTARTTDSRPGNGSNIQIRNLGNPLYVIDGVPYSMNEGTTGFGFNSGISGQNIFNNLGLEDIESITVLKDASASVYGLRASNGVVLITTKRGLQNETTSINVTSYYGLQNFTRFPRPANAGQYVRGLVESAQNYGNDPTLLYTPEQLAKWEAGTERGFRSYDYFDIVMRPNVPQYYLSANASGGTEKSNYYISASHVSQDAIIRDFTFDRTNIQANMTGKIAGGLSVGTQISGRVEKRHNVGVPGLDDYFNPLLSVFSMWPTESPYANDNPQYIHQTHNVNVNPATYKDDVTGYVDQWWRAMNVNMTAQYDFKFGLTAKGLYSYNFTNEDLDGFEYTYDAYLYDEATDTYFTRPGFGNQNPWREKHKRNVISRFAQFQLNYNKSFGDHNVAIVAAYEQSDNDNSRNVIHTVPPNNYIPIMNFADQDYLADEWSVEARAGYVGRINYNFQQKYLVEVLGRYDGSFLYAPENRWGFFPGVSVGWRIAEEGFFKDNLSNWVNDLKIRASYGETGSEMGVGAFAYLPGYSFGGGGVNDGRSAVLDGNFISGLRPRGLPITNLSWVTNQNKNIGIDFTIFQKLTGQIDVFERKRTGLPAARYDVLLPSEVGYTLPNENLNSDATRGMDGMITFRDQVGDVSYSIGINGTLARLRNLSTYKPRFGNSYNEYRNSIEDRWASVNWGYQVVGQFQSQDQIDNHTINNDGQGNRSLLPGDLIFKDVNGDGIINDMDLEPIGYAEGGLPYLNYGFNGMISYKGISLAMDLVGAGMQTYFRDWELKYPFQNNGNLIKSVADDHWRRADPYDPNSEWIAGTYPALRKDLNSHVNYRRSDFWVTNVRYLRLRNLEVGYSLPKSVLQPIGISGLRFFASGTNLISFDNVRKFEIDPEISSTNGLVYPQQRLYTFGFNLSL
jgi:TonB-linked SusC/RagA family outer membrane protein